MMRGQAPAIPADRAIGELVDRIRAAAPGRVVVLVDGGSGAGKTTLAELLAPPLDAEIVQVDAFYPGWDGLEAGSAMVRESVLGAENPGWRRWDWKTGRPAEWHPIDERRDLVIEGSGSLSAANRRLATFGIWIELDPAERKRRALGRDGEIYTDHWDRWAAQERAFFARERPDLLADAVVDGGSGRLLR